jgi:hypothetical protein
MKSKDITICSKVLGLGQCGSSLGKLYQGLFVGSRVLASNLAGDNHDFFKKKNVLFLSSYGTGGDPQVGEEIITKGEQGGVKNIDRLRDFLFEPIELKSGAVEQPRVGPDDENILIFTSGGGGSGNSLTRVIVEMLAEKNKKVLVVMAVPRRGKGKEGIKAKNNALRLINWFIENCFKKEDVSGINLALADNQMLFERVGIGNSLFEKVNDEIMAPFGYYHDLLNSSSIDWHSGSDATVDVSDLRRTIFNSQGGFLDFRRFELENISNKGVNIKTSSTYFGSFDIDTARSYLLVIELPKNGTNGNAVERKVLAVAAEDCMAKIQAKLKTPNSFATYFFSEKVQKVTGHLIVSGMRSSKSLDKLILDLKKDYEMLKRKDEQKPESLDLPQVEIP